MKKTIVCDSAWGDSLKERYEAESRKMIELQMQMQKVLEEAKAAKEKEKQSILERTKLMNQRDALEHERMVKMLTDCGYGRTFTI